MKFIACSLIVFFAFAAASKAAKEDQAKILETENFGGIKVGMGEKALVTLIGSTGLKKSKNMENAETGLVFQEWTWASKGLSIQMVDDAEGRSGKIVSAFTASKKCPLATAKGIKIGSTIFEVRAQYGQLNPNGEGVYYVGDTENASGIFFTIQAGKVVEIFFGTAT